MAKRPKRYGGTGQHPEEERHDARGRARRNEQQGEHLAEQGRRMRGGRASEAESWEREESLNDEDLEEGLGGFDDLDRLERGPRPGRGRG